jgi:hypothetical protein
MDRLASEPRPCSAMAIPWPPATAGMCSKGWGWPTAYPFGLTERIRIFQFFDVGRFRIPNFGLQTNKFPTLSRRNAMTVLLSIMLAFERYSAHTVSGHSSPRSTPEKENRCPDLTFRSAGSEKLIFLEVKADSRTVSRTRQNGLSCPEVGGAYSQHPLCEARHFCRILPEGAELRPGKEPKSVSSRKRNMTGWMRQNILMNSITWRIDNRRGLTLW